MIINWPHDVDRDREKGISGLNAEDAYKLYDALFVDNYRIRFVRCEGKLPCIIGATSFSAVCQGMPFTVSSESRIYGDEIHFTNGRKRHLFGEDEDGGTELGEAEKQGENGQRFVTQQKRLGCCEKDCWRSRLFAMRCARHRRSTTLPRRSLKRCVSSLDMAVLNG